MVGRPNPGPAAPAPAPEAAQLSPDLVYLDQVRAELPPVEDAIDIDVDLSDDDEAPVAVAATAAPAAAPITGAEPAPAEASPDVAAIFEALAAATSRAEIAEALTRPALRRQQLALTLIVRGELVQGQRLQGTTVADEEVEALALSLSTPSLLLRAVEQRIPQRVSVDSDPTARMIAGFARGPASGEVCVAPLLLRDRVVNLLYVQSAADSELDADAPAVLQQITQRAAAAYIRLIQQQKHT
jgi:hypothetical protein